MPGKRLEDSGLIGGRDSRPGVGDYELRCAVFVPRNVEPDPAPLGELHGVPQQVVQYLPDPGGIARDPAVGRQLAFEDEGDRRCCRALPVELRELADLDGQIERRDVELQASGLDARYVKQRTDEAQQVFALRLHDAEP